MFHNRKVTKRLLMERAGLVSEETFYSDEHQADYITQTLGSFMKDDEYEHVRKAAHHLPVEVVVKIYKELGLFDLAGTIELEDKLSEMMKSDFVELHQEINDAIAQRAMDADPMYNYNEEAKPGDPDYVDPTTGVSQSSIDMAMQQAGMKEQSEESKLKNEKEYLEYFLAGFFNLNGDDATREPDHESEDEILNMGDEYGFPSKSEKAIAFATAFDHDWDSMTAEEAEQAGLEAWNTGQKTFLQVVNKLEDEMKGAASDYKGMEDTYRDLRTSR